MTAQPQNSNSDQASGEGHTLEFTPEELKALSDFFNDEWYSMPDFLYEPIGKKFLIAAAKAGLFDE